MIPILGAMTGTSCDGLDLACVGWHKKGFRILWVASEKYPSALRTRILTIQSQPSTTLKNLLELNRDWGVWVGKTILKKTPRRFKNSILALHGQTVAHYPDSHPLGVTLQIGNPHVVSEITKQCVVYDFRSGDMAAGGQGAPLVPRFQQYLFQSVLKNKNQTISFHNLGGMSNCTLVNKNKTIAFDTGPGNTLIDQAIESISNGKKWFDKDGTLARQGFADQDAVKKMLRAISYFRSPPPKSTGREDFSLALLRRFTKSKNENLLATAVELTAQSIADAYKRFAPQNLKSSYWFGGGVQNSYLMNRIKSALQYRGIHCSIQTTSQFKIDPQYFEATAFSFLGLLTLKGYAMGGTWTGADSHAPSASIVAGKNWDSFFKTLTNARQIPIL